MNTDGHRYFDTHVHFDGVAAAADLESVVARADSAGVSRMLAVGGDAVRNLFAADFAAEHLSAVRAVVGYDRDCAGGHCPEQDLELLLKRGTTMAALGEIGLDYHYHPESRGAQRELLARMLDVARIHGLPVVVHSREADDDTVSLLGEHCRACDGDLQARIGVLHCFTGDASFARRLVDLGFYVSFSGIVSFRNADSLREAARIVPRNRLLIETDAPYLAPVPHRGKQNEPSLVPHVAEALAAARGESVKDIAEATFLNACRLFDWPE